MQSYLVRAKVKAGQEVAFQEWLDATTAASAGFETELRTAIRAGHASGPRLYFTLVSSRGDPGARVEEAIGDFVTLEPSVAVREVTQGEFEKD